MIRYRLKCVRDHQFEGWFGSMGDYDDQRESGLLSCPECGSPEVEKAIMAPAVRSSDTTAAIAAAIRTEIADTCTDVGDGFADEARAMFNGDKPAREIYGNATPKQAEAMRKEGIPALPLPDALNPKRAPGKLN